MVSLYDAWMERHLAARTGERRRRLAEGHGHAECLFAETIWLPVAGNFTDLQPEYEMADERGRPQLCRTVIQRLPGLCYGTDGETLPLPQRELIRRAMRHGRPAGTIRRGLIRRKFLSP